MRSLVNIGRKKQVFLEELRVSEGLEEERGFYEEEITRKATLINDLERSTLLEEVSWRQNSRALCIREGDKRTKFFHQVTNSNRRNNAIQQLVNDIVCSDQTRIREHIV
jgi:hypothetical protein